MTTTTFTFTGSVQTWVCPAGVTTVTIEGWGAEGGSPSLGTATPGKGGYVKCDYTVTPGVTYYIYVGGKGGNASGITGGAQGSNSGGAAKGGAGANYAGGGGGETSFRTGTSENDRIVVGPGGGGAAAPRGDRRGGAVSRPQRRSRQPDRAARRVLLRDRLCCRADRLVSIRRVIDVPEPDIRLGHRHIGGDTERTVGDPRRTRQADRRVT